MMSSYVKISKETWADTRQYLFEMLDTSPIFRTPEKGCGVVVKCPKN